MNADSKKLARKLREQWDIYHSEVAPAHMSGFESAVKILSDQMVQKDPKFKRVEFLRQSINY